MLCMLKPTRILLQDSSNVPMLLWVQCARSIASHAGKFVPSCCQWHCLHQAAFLKSPRHNMLPQDLAQVQLDHPQNHEPLHAGQAWKSLARPPWAMNPCILGLRRNPLNPKISSFDRSISNMGLLLCLPLPGWLPPKGVPIQKLSREESIEMDPEVNPKIHRCSIAELVKAEMAVWQHNELLQLLKPPLCDIKKRGLPKSSLTLGTTRTCQEDLTSPRSSGNMCMSAAGVSSPSPAFICW